MERSRILARTYFDDPRVRGGLPEAQADARLMFKRKGPPHAAYGSDAPRQLTRAKWWLATAVVLFASLFAFIVAHLS